MKSLTGASVTANYLVYIMPHGPHGPVVVCSVRFSAGLLDAVDGEDVHTVVEVAAGVGDVGASGEPDGADR